MSVERNLRCLIMVHRGTFLIVQCCSARVEQSQGLPFTLGNMKTKHWFKSSNDILYSILEDLRKLSAKTSQVIA